MNERYVGHRGSSGNDWSWEPPRPPNNRPRGVRPSRRFLVLAGLVMFGVAALFVALALEGRGGSTATHTPPPSPSPAQSQTAPPTATPHPTRSPSPRPTARPTRTPTPRPTRTPTPRPTGRPTPSPALSPTPSASPAPAVQLAAWLPDEGRWETGTVPSTTRFKEGSSAGFLVRLNGIHPGEAYGIEVAYACAVNGAAGFDFLAGLPDQPGVMADGGPKRMPPDATIAIPDDNDIAFDDKPPGRVFSLWGGSFDGTPTGPVSGTPCVPGQASMGVFALTVTARQETAFLAFGAHLASAADWGTGMGASSAKSALQVSVRLDDGEWSPLALAPASVAP